MVTKYDRVDVWRCYACDIEYYVPAVPHKPYCPSCGTTGWWQRFLSQQEISVLGNAIPSSLKMNRI